MKLLKDLAKTLLIEFRGLKTRAFNCNIAIGPVKGAVIMPRTASYNVEIDSKVRNVRCFETTPCVHPLNLNSYLETVIFSPVNCQPAVFTLRLHSGIPVAETALKTLEMKVSSVRPLKSPERVRSIRITEKSRIRTYRGRLKVSLAPTSLRKDAVVLKALRVLNLKYPGSRIVYLGKYSGVPDKAQNFSLKGNKLVFECMPSRVHGRNTYMVFRDESNDRLIMVRRHEQA